MRFSLTAWPARHRPLSIRGGGRDTELRQWAGAKNVNPFGSEWSDTSENHVTDLHF